MEDSLLAWAHHWLDHNDVKTYPLLQAHAQQLGDCLVVTDFQCCTPTSGYGVSVCIPVRQSAGVSLKLQYICQHGGVPARTQ